MIEEAIRHPERSRGIQCRNLKAPEYSRANQKSALAAGFLDFAALRSE
jgi:hypothetical protein